MKTKLFFAALAVFAMTACGGNSTKENVAEAPEVEATVEVDGEAACCKNDSTACCDKDAEEKACCAEEKAAE